MAGMYGQPELEPNSMGAPEQPPVSLRQIPPSRWAMLVLNIILLVVCAFAFATSPLAPWYRAPNAGAAPLTATPSATPSATASYAPPTSPPAPAAPTTTPTGSGAGGPAPTATPRLTATPTPLGPPTATPTHIAPTATKTPCDICG